MAAMPPDLPQPPQPGVVLIGYNDADRVTDAVRSALAPAADGASWTAAPTAM
ncbi:hypothetical protein ABZ915_04805 [Streptomyces sp. NPDC046915]|uniref:hypothetical protein n=1 Tax=Streptomyces sp. NPDC046915 TaxID=3155257 RepID=UPI0033CA22E5